MSSWTERLDEAKAGLVEHDADPLRQKIEELVRPMEAIGSAALCEMLDLPPTSANGRRLGRIMAELGFVPIRSRQFRPGGWRTSLCRGWARPWAQPRGTKAVTVERYERRANADKPVTPFHEAAS
jgi:hypothetical protein